MTKVKATSRENTAAVPQQGATVAPEKDAWKKPKGRQRAKRKAKGATRKSVPVRNNSIHPEIPLRETMVAVDLGGTCSRFRVTAAQVNLLPSGRRPIRWRLAGELEEAISVASVILQRVMRFLENAGERTAGGH